MGGRTGSVFIIHQSTYPDNQQLTDPTPIVPDANGAYHLNGKIDILSNISGAAAGLRKGVYGAGYSYVQNALTTAILNIYFDQLPSQDSDTAYDDANTIYFKRNSDSMIFFNTNRIVNNGGGTSVTQNTWLDTTAPYISEGPITICPFAISNPSPWNVQTSNCQAAVIDRTAPTITFTDINGSTFTYATSSTTVIVVGNDPVDGAMTYTINLVGPSFNQTSTNTSVTQSYSATFSGLADGQYTATVTDLAGNSASNSFTVDTSNPSGSAINPNGGPYNPSGPNALVIQASAASGVKHIDISGPSFDYPTSFNCPQSAKVGPLQLSTPGTYTITRTNCAEVAVSTDMPVSTAAVAAVMTGVGITLTHSTTIYPDIDALGASGTSTITVTSGLCTMPSSDAEAACLQMHVSAPGDSTGCQYTCTPGCCFIKWEFYNQGLSDESFSITNTTDTPIAYGINPNINLAVSKAGGVNAVSGTISFPQSEIANQGDSIAGTIEATPVGQFKPNDNPPAHSSSTYEGITISSCTPADNVLQQLLAQLLASILPDKNPYCWAGSEAVFISSVPMSFDFQEPDGVVIDTNTLGIYGYDETSGQWTRDVVANQEVSISSTGYVVATGSFTRTGTFGVYFMGHDSSAPITTFEIQGSSYAFDGTTLVSTDSFLVLTATDPVVDGFASTVATITYRLDPALGGDFSVYDTSIPATLGTHVLQYRSYDYAGNAEDIKTATFTVTAGTVFRGSSDALVSGSVLAGFLGVGARAEVVSRAENDWTLLLSSPDASGLLSVTNVGSVGVGRTGEGTLDVASDAAAVGALGLRSGNTVSTDSSQIAFGLGGTGEMAHSLRTQHSTATFGNSVDFWLWDPVAGSTTAPARLEIASLQAITSASGGSLHILPVGEADAELEVSNGISEGGGTIRRAAAVAPSSREFKSDIHYFSDREIERAARDVLALKHASFRYKHRAPDGTMTADHSQPLREGLIYEDAPDSIRMKGDAVSLDDRVANLEMALKSRLKRLAELEKRLKKLQEGR